MRALLGLLVLAVVAGGCLGGPEAEVGGAALGPAPAYAVRIASHITVQHFPPAEPGQPAPPPEPPMTIEAGVLGLLRTDPADAAGTTRGSFQLCSLDLPPVGGRTLVFRPDVWARIPEVPVALNAGADASWTLAPWRILMGVHGVGVDEPLPTDPSDPRVDEVEDDRPGVAITIDVNNLPDPLIDASVRVRFPNGRVALAGDGRLVGEVELHHDVWVWFADMPWPVSNRNAAEANDFMRKKLVEWPILSQQNDFTGVPIDPATASCGSVAFPP